MSLESTRCLLALVSVMLLCSTVNSFERRLEDRLAIEALMTRYAHAYDTRDWDLLRTVFGDGAVLDYEPVGGIKGDVDEIVAFMSRSMGTKGGWKGFFTFSQHMVSNFDISFEGHGQATMRAMFYNPNGIRWFPVQPTFYVGGWYIHKLIKVDGEWKSISMEEEVAYNTLVPSVLAQLATACFVLYIVVSKISSLFVRHKTKAKKE